MTKKKVIQAITPTRKKLVPVFILVRHEGMYGGEVRGLAPDKAKEKCLKGLACPVKQNEDGTFVKPYEPLYPKGYGASPDESKAAKLKKGREERAEAKAKAEDKKGK